MKWNIGTKITASFGLILLIFVSIGAISYRSTNALIQASNLQKTSQHIIIELERISLLVKEAGSSQKSYIITGSEADLAPFRAAQVQLEHTVQSLQQQLRDPKQIENLRRLTPILQEKMQHLQLAIDARQRPDGGFEEAQNIILSESGRRLSDLIGTRVAEMESLQKVLVDNRTEVADRSALNAQRTILYGTASTFLLLLVICFVLTRNIASPLKALSGTVQSVRDGNLNMELPHSSRRDEIGILTNSFHSMLETLHDFTLQTRSAIENLNSASAEILASTKQQAASTSEQSAAVQQTTATVEEISQTGSQISDKAKKVAAAAESTSTASQAGIHAVKATNGTMLAIQEQAEAVAENIVVLSERNQAVGQIISTVNDISERSNLLALNASIEAAAAGEHGRSFAVVANELKNLADQSKQATVQVRSILGEIQNGINTSVMLTEEAVKRVESGRKQADLAEQTISRLSTGIQESVQAFQQIIAATNQQQIGFEQVNQAMKNIKTAAEQTAIGTGQLEKATLNINALGQQLRNSIERYKI